MTDGRIGETSLLRAIEVPWREAGPLVVRVGAATSSLGTFGQALLAGLRGDRHRRRWEIDLEARSRSRQAPAGS